MDMDSRHNVYMKRMQTEQVKVGAFADKERAYVWSKSEFEGFLS